MKKRGGNWASTLPGMSCSWTGFSLFLLFLYQIQFTAASTIATFSDDNCEKPYKSLDGPNGYPDGYCSSLPGGEKFSSFKIDELDPGCAVTIYGRNSKSGDPCSSSNTLVAELTKCYNSTWIYYSIDGCIKPASTSSFLSTTFTSVTSSATSSATSSETSSSPSETPSSPPSTSSSAEPSPEPQPASHNYTGAIVGGIVGGFALIAIVIALIWFFWYKPRRSKPKVDDAFLRGMYSVEKPPESSSGPQSTSPQSPNPQSAILQPYIPQFGDEKSPAADVEDIRPAAKLSSAGFGPVELQGTAIGEGSSTPVSPVSPNTAAP